eukprot:scaffold223111_cov15-Tisochrysis_lutea.AAC.1
MGLSDAGRVLSNVSRPPWLQLNKTLESMPLHELYASGDQEGIQKRVSAYSALLGYSSTWFPAILCRVKRTGPPRSRLVML